MLVDGVVVFASGVELLLDTLPVGSQGFKMCMKGLEAEMRKQNQEEQAKLEEKITDAKENLGDIESGA